MQPTYLPYLGYFQLMAKADVFVFLDDVQFARRSWQQRNRIWGAAGEVMLSVPVQKTDREALIADIKVSDTEPWRENHLASLRHAYAKRPFFEEGMAFMAAQLGAQTAGLADLNIAIIEAVAARLGLVPQFVRASALSTPDHRSEHLLAICRAVGADAYLSPMGSHDYMIEDRVFAAASFPVYFQSFTEVPYAQGFAPFVPYMAFIDAVMNVGWAEMRRLIDLVEPRRAYPTPAARHASDRAPQSGPAPLRNAPGPARCLDERTAHWPG